MAALSSIPCPSRPRSRGASKRQHHSLVLQLHALDRAGRMERLAALYQQDPQSLVRAFESIGARWTSNPASFGQWARSFSAWAQELVAWAEQAQPDAFCAACLAGLGRVGIRFRRPHPGGLCRRPQNVMTLGPSRPPKGIIPATWRINQRSAAESALVTHATSQRA